MSVERNSANKLRLDFVRHCCHSGSHRDCYGVQLKRRLHGARSQRLLLLSEKATPMVLSGNRTAFISQKYGLSQASSIHISHHDLYIPVVNHCDVSRIQQKIGGRASLVDVRRIFFPTFRVSKVYPCPFYCQIPGKTGGQTKKFCIWLFAQFNRIGIFFHSNFISAGFWNGNDNLRGHLYNAFYRRASKKISVPFRPGNNSLYSIRNFNHRISSKKNHRLSQSMGRSFRNRFPSHSILLRLWKRRVLGDGTGRKFSKTFSSSRGAYGLYFFSGRGRTGVCGNNSNSHFILDFYMERVYDGLPGQRPFWNSFSNRTDSINRFTSFYKPGSGFRPSPNKRIDAAFYKHGGIVNDSDDAFSGCFTKYLRAG